MILFVPGIKGTELYDDENKRWFPATRQDLKLLKIKNPLEARGLLKKVIPFGSNIFSQEIYHDFIEEFGEDLIVFPYDWRRSILEYVDKLANFLIEVSETHGEFTLVAHSMGGLLSKLALVRIYEKNKSIKVNKFITVGTPWHGAPDAYKALIYGEPGFFEKLSEFLQILDVKTTMSLARQYPSVYQLLPTKNYFEQTDGNFVLSEKIEGLSYDDIKMKVQLIYNQENEEFIDVWKEYIDPLHIELEKPLPSEIEHICLIGHSIPTIYKLPENENGGKVFKKFKKSSVFMNGDGVVPLYSAKPEHTSSIFYLKGEHKSLCSEKSTLTFIRNCLENNYQSLPEGVIIETDSQAPVNNALKSGFIAKIMCPVESTILDDEGKYIAGVFDTSITEISDLAAETSMRYYHIGQAKYLYFEKQTESDLSFEISAYKEGVASVSLEDYEENNEFKFETIPVNRNSSVKLVIPANKAISESVLKVGAKVLKLKQQQIQTDITLDIPTIQIQIEAAQGVKKVPHGHTYSGQIVLKIEADSKDNVEELFYSVDGKSIHKYIEDINLDLDSGEHIIEAFGKDIYNRDIIKKEKRVWIEYNPPMTKLDLVIDPEGIYLAFKAESNHSPVETFYRFFVSERENEDIEWEKIDMEGMQIPVPTKKIRENPKGKIGIEFLSKHKYFDIEEEVNKFDLHLGDIPILMWEEKTSAITPETIFENIVQNEYLDLNDFHVTQLIHKKYYDIEPFIKVGDNVKSIKFQSERLSIEVRFSEKYSLYFSGPPTELLKIKQNYAFSFELRTERSNENITTSNPVAKLHAIRAKNLKPREIRLEEKDGTFKGHFTVDDNFKLFKHKLIITDSKNVSPPLREITLILSDDEK